MWARNQSGNFEGKIDKIDRFEGKIHQNKQTESG